jgi:hypothetical protein
MRYANNDEYDGQWKSNPFKGGRRHGEGVFKEASTGKVEKRLYENDEVKKVLYIFQRDH